jgi:hypothetical protein
MESTNIRRICKDNFSYILRCYGRICLQSHRVSKNAECYADFKTVEKLQNSLSKKCYQQKSEGNVSVCQLLLVTIKMVGL